MLKKLLIFNLLFSITLCAVEHKKNQQNQNIDVFSFIPNASQVRHYCQNNPYRENVSIIREYLQRGVQSRQCKNNIRVLSADIESIDNAIERLKKDEELLKEHGYTKFYQFFLVKNSELRMKRAFLEISKKANEEKIIPPNFPRQGKEEEINQFTKAYNALLQELKIHNKEQEKGFMKEAFENAYDNSWPWNTYTLKEKFETGGTIAGCGALIGGIFLLGKDMASFSSSSL